VTVGRRRRRRFVQSIEDGIAQLAHYREFFEIAEHQEKVFEKYGVRFKEPVYGLIVGNYENINQAKIQEASRRLEKFEIIDYDLLLQLYLAGKGLLPSMLKSTSG
jgi:hypothetical protein